MKKRKKKWLHQGSGGKWSKSVAQMMEESGFKFKANEELDKNHIKIKNPGNHRK